MPSIYDIKPWFQSRLRPFTGRLARTGVRANQVTMSALVLSLLSGACIGLYPESRWPMLLVPVALSLRMILNAIDGMLAREHDMQSALGALLNELGDVLSDAALYLPFALVPGISAPTVVTVVVLSIVSEMTGVVAVQIGASRRYDGPMGKSDRAFVFGALGLSLGLGASPQPWLDPVLAAVAVLLAATIVNRARNALREVAE